jgi:hypothetical protein
VDHGTNACSAVRLIHFCGHQDLGCAVLAIGFQATLVLGGYAFWLGMSAVSAVAIVVVHVRSGKKRIFLHCVAFRHCAAWFDSSPVLGLGLAALRAVIVRPVRMRLGVPWVPASIQVGNGRGK